MSMCGPKVHEGLGIGNKKGIGDFLGSAVGQTRKLLKQAHSSETSKGNEDKARTAFELSKSIAEAYKQTNTEGWAMNRGLHYNNWANISSAELSEVVNSFHSLSVGTCQPSGAIFRLSSTAYQLYSRP